MAQVVVVHEPTCTRFVVTGKVTADELLVPTSEQYPLLNNRPRLWDLRQCDLTGLTAADLAHMAETVQELTQEVGKVAMLVDNPGAYRLVCQYLVQPSRLRARLEAAVFLREEEALRWLRRS